MQQHVDISVDVLLVITTIRKPSHARIRGLLVTVALMKDLVRFKDLFLTESICRNCDHYELYLWRLIL